mgnify:CR=1 FL=1
MKKETDPLDEIIRTFNERWFQGWSATPEEQKVKFVNIAESIRNHPDFESKYKNNIASVTDRIDAETLLYQAKINLELAKADAKSESSSRWWWPFGGDDKQAKGPVVPKIDQKATQAWLDEYEPKLREAIKDSKLEL